MRGRRGYSVCVWPCNTFHPICLHPFSLINNCFNPPVILQTSAQFVRVSVCCTQSVPRTVHQISRAALHRASPTATKGNCFLIKPPALIPMIFSRHGLAHTHPLKRWQRLKQGDIQQNPPSCKLDKCVIGFVAISLLSTARNKAAGKMKSFMYWSNKWIFTPCPI